MWLMTYSQSNFDLNHDLQFVYNINLKCCNYSCILTFYYDVKLISFNHALDMALDKMLLAVDNNLNKQEGHDGPGSIT